MVKQVFQNCLHQTDGFVSPIVTLESVDPLVSVVFDKVPSRPVVTDIGPPRATESEVWITILPSDVATANIDGFCPDDLHQVACSQMVLLKPSHFS